MGVYQGRRRSVPISVPIRLSRRTNDRAPPGPDDSPGRHDRSDGTRNRKEGFFPNGQSHGLWRLDPGDRKRRRMTEGVSTDVCPSRAVETEEVSVVGGRLV